MILNFKDVTVEDDGERFQFYVKGVKTGHSISSDPLITDEKRLQAHVTSVGQQEGVCVRFDILVSGKFTATDLRLVSSCAKNEARRDNVKLDGNWQINGIDENGERTSAGTTFASGLSKKMITKIMAEDPDCVELDFYCESYWLDDTLPLIERWEERQPTGEGAYFSVLKEN